MCTVRSQQLLMVSIEATCMKAAVKCTLSLFIIQLQSSRAERDHRLKFALRLQLCRPKLNLIFVFELNADKLFDHVFVKYHHLKD